ncbi:uncharacterized protein LOC135847905 isoform X2 [Planococcus citri]|uniref:uncharacterized protein LOC135847905 isoform X2 n=1 Tax=Planococcus citri TaxID=170843 RepID=UPI0031FA4896
MKSYFGLITIFLHVFLQISTKSNAASIPSRNSGVNWITEELQPVQNHSNSPIIDAPLEDMARKLLRILDEMYGLIDIMPADDPNINNDEGYQPSVPHVANGKNMTSTQKNDLNKQRYLDYYKQRIIQFTGVIPSSSSKSVENNLRNQQLEPLNDITRKAEERRELAVFSDSPRMISLYPTCNNSNMDDPLATAIHVTFDLSMSKPSPDIFMNVTSAVLKIYKKPLRRDSTGLPILEPNSNVTFMAVYYKNAHNKKDPTKKGTKLGEQTLGVDEERWTEWDIKRAVSAWYNTSRNNGITIKVADDQIRLPAREFFNIPINCSYITGNRTLSKFNHRNGLG